MFSPPVYPRLQEPNYHLEVGGRGEACKYSPHPFRGAGRDGTLLWVLQSFQARWATPPPPTPSQKHHKIEEKTRLQNNTLFLQNNQKVSLKVDPKIVKIVSRRLFCVTEKTLNFTSVFFIAFAVSGTPGPSKIVQFPCKYHHFRDATLSQK